MSSQTIISIQEEPRVKQYQEVVRDEVKYMLFDPNKRDRYYQVYVMVTVNGDRYGKFFKTQQEAQSKHPSAKILTYEEGEAMGVRIWG